jgi:uncharacterized DUF497 family protein
VADIRFEWDEVKNHSNRRKHSVTFEDAIGVFDDPLHISRPGRIEEGEQRWETFGFADESLFLIVVNIVRESFEGQSRIDVVRIISARRATRKEKRSYENQNG